MVAGHSMGNRATGQRRDERAGHAGEERRRDEDAERPYRPKPVRRRGVRAARPQPSGPVAGNGAGEPDGAVEQAASDRQRHQPVRREGAAFRPGPRERAQQAGGEQRRQDDERQHLPCGRLRADRLVPRAVLERLRHVQRADRHRDGQQHGRHEQRPERIAVVWHDAPEPERHEPRDVERCDQGETEDAEVQHEVADAVADGRPGVAAEQPEFRRQVVAVGAEEAHLARLVALLRLRLVERQPLVQAAARRQGLQPAIHVAAARHTGDVVDLLVDVERAQRLQHAESERGTADAAAGEREADQRIGLRACASLGRIDVTADFGGADRLRGGH